MKKLIISFLMLLASQVAQSDIVAEVQIILILNAIIASDAPETVHDIFGNGFGLRLNSGDLIPNKFLENPVVENIYSPGIGTITSSPTVSVPSGSVLPGESFSSTSINMTNDGVTPGGVFTGDVLSVAFNGGNHTVGDLSFESIAFNFLSPAGTALAGLELADLDGLTLADFESANFTLFAKDSSFNSVIATGAITSFNVTVVPVPALAWLFGSCLLGTFAWAKRY